MKVGVLGTGFGAYHVELYSKIEEVEAIYVFGRNLEKLEHLKSKFGITIVTAIDDIIENEDMNMPLSATTKLVTKTMTIQN